MATQSQMRRTSVGERKGLSGCGEHVLSHWHCELADGVKLTLGPEDYSRATAMRVLQTKTNSSQVICRASLLPMDGDEVLGPQDAGPGQRPKRCAGDLR